MEKFAKLVERHLTWFQLITGGSLLSLSGWISHWAATQTIWIAQRGPYAIWLATLSGAILAALLILASAWARYAYMKGSAIQHWRERVDSINPLDREFNKRRINISDLASPIDRRVISKRFIECELMGPANIVFLGSMLKDIGFINCDTCVVPFSNIAVKNVLAFQSVEILGGRIANCTVFIPPAMVAEFAAMGAQFITFTGDESIDEALKKLK